jgi:hypothetical protein
VGAGRHGGPGAQCLVVAVRAAVAGPGGAVIIAAGDWLPRSETGRQLPLITSDGYIVVICSTDIP